MQLKKETIKTRAAQLIRKMILKGDIAPGQRIVPGELAQQLDTGRGSVREALMELEAEGLVKSSPYRGTYVAEFSAGETKEICTIRYLLETYAVEEAKDLITEQDLRNLTEIASQMRQATMSYDLEEVVRLDARFHGYFVQKVSQSVLYDTWSYTNSRLAYLFFTALSRKELFPLAQVADNHYALIGMLQKYLWEKCSIDEYSKSLLDHYMHLIIN